MWRGDDDSGDGVKMMWSVYSAGDVEVDMMVIELEEKENA